MGEQTGISWCDHTFNPWWGCVKVSPGCQHCYAEGVAERFSSNIWGPAKTTDRRLFDERHWREPLSWNKKAQKQGVRRRVFSASMADVFEDHPQVEASRAQLIDLIGHTPNLIWLLLTKRPENIMPMLEFALLTLHEAGYAEEIETPEEWLERMGDRVWLGTSVENQATADERIPHLMTVPAAIRFLSVEPLLGPIDLWEARYPQPDGSRLGAITTWKALSINWVIVGGESGNDARTMSLDWVRRIRDDCRVSGVPFFFKQWGEWIEGSQPIPDESFVGGSRININGRAITTERFAKDHPTYRMERGSYFLRAGKKDTGDLLDGVQHHNFPETP